MGMLKQCRVQVEAGACYGDLMRLQAGYTEGYLSFTMSSDKESIRYIHQPYSRQLPDTDCVSVNFERALLTST